METFLLIPSALGLEAGHGRDRFDPNDLSGPWGVIRRDLSTPGRTLDPSELSAARRAGAHGLQDRRLLGDAYSLSVTVV